MAKRVIADLQHDDQWQAHLTRQAAMAIGEWLEASVRIDRPIATLRIEDLEGMATAAISRWIREVAARATVEVTALPDLLMP